MMPRKGRKYLLTGSKGGYACFGAKCVRCGDVRGDGGNELCAACHRIMPVCLLGRGQTWDEFVGRGDEGVIVGEYGSCPIGRQLTRASTEIVAAMMDERKRIHDDAGGWAMMMGWNAGGLKSKRAKGRGGGP